MSGRRQTLRFKGRSDMPRTLFTGRFIAAALATGLLTACAGETIHNGFLLRESQLEQIPEGATKEQVLLALGSPSVTNTFGTGGETFYYIAQQMERPVAFMNPRIVEQQVVSVRFDANETVTAVQNYGLKDGKVFNFSNRKTPTTGKELSFISQLISGVSARPF